MSPCLGNSCWSCKFFSIAISWVLLVFWPVIFTLIVGSLACLPILEGFFFVFIYVCILISYVEFSKLPMITSSYNVYGNCNGKTLFHQHLQSCSWAFRVVRFICCPPLPFPVHFGTNDGTFLLRRHIIHKTRHIIHKIRPHQHLIAHLRTNSGSLSQQQGMRTVALASGHGFVGLTRLLSVGGSRFGRKSWRWWIP